jgi:hypothetical protein
MAGRLETTHTLRLEIVFNNQRDITPVFIHYLRNKSWKPECVGSFNMYWRILVFYPKPEARYTIY